MRLVRHTVALMIAAASLSMAACASTRVSASLERGMDFTRYNSYSWAADDRFSTGDPRLDNNQFFQKRLRGDIERVLAERGFEKASSATAGLVIHYHASVKQQIDVNALDQQYGYCEDCNANVYDAGTITLDFVDATTNKLVWRGWSEGSLDGIDDQSVIEARVDDAVSRILQQLPPRF